MKILKTIVSKIEKAPNKSIISGMLGLSALILVVAVVVSISYRSNEEANEKPKVAATIFPIYDIVRQVAGDQLEVVLILPPGASPHTFEPLPSNVTALSGSEAVFAVGHKLDDWVLSLASAADSPQVIVVDKEIELLESDDSHDDETDNEVKVDYVDGEREFDPHYFLSIPNAMLISMQVRDELSRLYPQSAEVFSANQNNFAVSLGKLDNQIRSQLADLASPKLATFHNAWSYFARDYGLTIEAVFEPFPGKEPTPAYLASFSNAIQENQVQVVFTEPQLSTGQISGLVNDLGIKIAVLDPIGGTDNTDSFIKLMEYNSSQILNNLR